MPPPQRITLAAQSFAVMVIGLCATRCAAGPAPPSFALSNGLRVIIVERRESPLVAIELWVRAGARDERAGEYGAAHFLEHILFKGTRTRGVGEADSAIENLGATLNAATGPDYARFYTCASSAHAADALAVLADVVRNATLPEKEIERERQVILDELAQRESDPDAILIDRMYSATFGYGAYGRLPGGAPDEIRKRTRDDLLSFYHRTYAPGRSTLVLVGDIAPDQARGLAMTSFGDWPVAEAAEGAERKDAQVGGRSEHAQPTEPGPRRIDEAADVASPMAGVACRAPAATDGVNACAAQIVAALLGRSDSGGRLATPRLAGCGARASFAPRRNESLFLITSSTPLVISDRIRTRAQIAAVAAEQERAIESVLDGLVTLPPTAGEILAAKEAMLGRAVFDQETDTGLAADIGVSATAGGEGAAAWRAAVERTTPAEVRKFILEWLDAPHRLSVTLTPRAAGTAGQPR